jgi:intracellular septation protein
VFVFGGLTLWLSNDIFIKIKADHSVRDVCAGIVRRPSFQPLFIKLLLGHTLRLPEDAWRTLTWRWSLFFLVLAL